MKADTPSNTGKQEGRQWETRGRQDLRKVDAPCNTGHMYVGRQWETIGGTMGDNGRHARRQEGGHTIQHRHTYLGRQWETIGGDKGETRPSGRRTHPS